MADFLEDATTLSAIQFHPLIEWRYIAGKGRGIFAKQDIPADTLVECSPVVIFPAADLVPDKDVHLTLTQYVFWWSDEPGEEQALGLGFLSLYNHSASPNIEMEEGPLPNTMQALTLCFVPAGTELTFDYGETWFHPL